MRRSNTVWSSTRTMRATREPQSGSRSWMASGLSGASVSQARTTAWRMRFSSRSRIAAKIDDMQALRDSKGLAPLVFGVAGYVVCRSTEAAARREVERITDVRQNAAGYANYEQWLANTQLEQRVSLEDYSVSNRGL